MYTILPIIILAIEILLIGSFISYVLKTKTIINKSSLWYVLPLLAIVFVLYVLGVHYNAYVGGYDVTIYDYIDVFKYLLKTTTFEIEIGYIEPLAKHNVYYEIAFFVSFIALIFSIYSSILSLFINIIKNKFRVFFALRKDCDILYGNNEINKVYFNNSKNCIVWYDDFEDKETIKKFYANKVPVIKAKFTKETLKIHLKPIIRRENIINFISFEDSDTNLNLINVFKEFTSTIYKDKELITTKRFFLKVEIDINNQITLKNQILKDKKYAAFIDCINRFDLISLNYIDNYPITKNLPQGFIDYSTGTITNDKDINVFYLGFGRVSKALHRASLMNNQLATIENQKIKPFRVNYYAFDNKEKSRENSNIIFYSKRYDSNIEEFSNTEKYFPSCEKLDDIVFDSLDLNSYSFIEKIIKEMFAKENQKTFNRIIVSFGNDIDNIDYALKIHSFLQQHKYLNYEIFVRVRIKNKNVMELLNDPKMIVFGDLDSIINHDVIVNEKLMDLAKTINKKYNNKKLYESSWYELSVIKQLSNIYSSLNTRLKLNLLGYDYEISQNIIDNSEIVKELEKALSYNHKGYDDYYFYLNNNYLPSNSLAYQEHLRWNAFYISNGYVPFPKGEIEIIKTNDDYSFYKDDDNIKMHACITTFEGLDEYHRLLARLLSKENGQDFDFNLEKVETYKYDYMLIEEFKNIFTNTKYKLVKK